MSAHLERDVKFLKRYAIVSTLAFGVLAVGAFTRRAPTKFEEIDVERINIVEPDGKYRLVISNRPRSIGPIYKGQPFGYDGGGRPGLIFFNDEGSENGGFTFTGSRDSTGRYRASTHMSFDQFDSDQVLNLDYNDNNGRRQVGVTINDYVDENIYDVVMRRDSINRMTDTVARRVALAALFGPRNGIPFSAPRLFAGRDAAKSSIVDLKDRQGKSRLRLVVDSLGSARIEFLNGTGQVTSTLPPR